MANKDFINKLILGDNLAVLWKKNFFYGCNNF